jgi:hypothetical protein
VCVYGNHSCGCEYKFFQFPTGEIHTNAQLEFVYLCTGNEAVTGEKTTVIFFETCERCGIERYFSDRGVIDMRKFFCRKGLFEIWRLPNYGGFDLGGFTVCNFLQGYTTIAYVKAF